MLSLDLNMVEKGCSVSPACLLSLKCLTNDKNSHPKKTFDLSLCAVCCVCQGWGGGVLPGTAEYLLGEPNSLLSQPMPRVFPGVLGDLQEPVSLKDRSHNTLSLPGSLQLLTTQGLPPAERKHGILSSGLKVSNPSRPGGRVGMERSKVKKWDREESGCPQTPSRYASGC